MIKSISFVYNNIPKRIHVLRRHKAKVGVYVMPIFRKMDWFQDNRGFALVLTLWVLMILSVLMLTYSMSVNSNIKNATYLKDKILASTYADSALALIAVKLMPPKKDKSKKSGKGAGAQSDSADASDTGGASNTSSTDTSNTDNTGGSQAATGTTGSSSGQSGTKVDPKQVEESYKKLGKWYVNSRDWSVSRQKPPGEDDEENIVIDKTKFRRPKIVCEVSAEDAKFPLNSITKLKKAPPNISPIVFSGIKAFLKKPDSGKSKSTSGDAQGTGAQANQQQQAGTSPSDTGTSSAAGTDTSSKDQKSYKQFSCVEQLLEIKDMDKNVYDGDRNTPGLKKITTVFSDGKIYVNKADKHALAMIPGLDEGAANQLEARISGDNYLKSFDKLNSIIGSSSTGSSSTGSSNTGSSNTGSSNTGSSNTDSSSTDSSSTGSSNGGQNKIQNWLSLVPKYFRIKVKVTVRGITCVAESVVKVDKDNIEIVFINKG